MALVTVQESEAIEARRWRWAIWIDGRPEELDAVDHVVYALHSTFSDPIRTVSNRKTKFRLQSTGWGEFTVGVRVVGKDGGETSLSHNLRLFDAGERTLRKPTVFLSYAASDAQAAQSVMRELEERGIQVRSAGSTLLAGEDWRSTVESFIRAADAIVPVVTGSVGNWVRKEVEFARATGKPVLGLHFRETGGPLAAEDLPMFAELRDGPIDEAINRLGAEIHAIASKTEEG